MNPGQKLVILEEVVLGVLPTLLQTVKHELYLFDFSEVEDIDVCSAFDFKVSITLTLIYVLFLNFVATAH